MSVPAGGSDRDALALSVVPYVRWRARRLVRNWPGESEDDAFQAMMHRVVEAAPRFDPSLANFLTFAAWQCRRAATEWRAARRPARQFELAGGSEWEAEEVRVPDHREPPPTPDAERLLSFVPEELREDVRAAVMGGGDLRGKAGDRARRGLHVARRRIAAAGLTAEDFGG